MTEASADSARRTALLVEEGDKVCPRSATCIRDRFFVVLGEEFDGGERGDVVFCGEIFIVSGICIDIGDNTLIDGLGLRQQWERKRDVHQVLP